MRRHSLGRAVDQDDKVLGIVVQSRPNTQTAKTCFRTLLQGLTYGPRVSITDPRKSDGAAQREMLPGEEHHQSRSRTNRCETAHRPTRQRERHMPGCTSPGHAQRFLAAYGSLAHHCRPRRPLWSVAEYRQERRHRFASWPYRRECAITPHFLYHIATQAFSLSCGEKRKFPLSAVM
jgi:putative transposase